MSTETTETKAQTPAKKSRTTKSRQAKVVKAKMQKTVVVEVTRRVRHAKYGKFVSQRRRYMAHDETNTCKIGDVVVVEETRPLSKNKRWRVKEIVRRATGA